MAQNLFTRIALSRTAWVKKGSLQGMPLIQRDYCAAPAGGCEGSAVGVPWFSGVLMPLPELPLLAGGSVAPDAPVMPEESVDPAAPFSPELSALPVSPEVPPVPGVLLPAAVGSFATPAGAGVVAALLSGAVMPEPAAPACGSAGTPVLSVAVLAGGVEGVDSIVVAVGEVSDSMAP